MRRTVPSSDTLEKARKTADDLVATARAALSDIETAARAWKGEAQDQLGAFSESASRYASRGREEAAGMADHLRQRIEQRPWPALAITAAAGVLLGIFLSRRA